MDAEVQSILRSNDDPNSKRVRFKKFLSAPELQQSQVVTALLDNLHLNPASGVACLAVCVAFAPHALREQLLHGEKLATALIAAGARASAVADVMCMLLGQGGGANVQEQARLKTKLLSTAEAMWHTFARSQNVLGWQDLKPSPARAAAIKLWSKRAEFEPPGISAASLARWLAQPDAAETEKQLLLASIRRLWAEQGATTSVQVEDALGALLHSMKETHLSAEQLAEAVVRSASESASPWICYLLVEVAEPTASAAAQLLSAPAGRAALFFAWASLYGAVLSAIFGSLVGVADCVPVVLHLLADICKLLAKHGCWQELASAMLCITVNWPHRVDGSPGWNHEGMPRKAVSSWLDFCRCILVDLADETCESPLGGILPLIIAAVPALHAPSGGCPETGATDDLCQLLLSLRTDLSSRAKYTGSCMVSTGLYNLGNTCYLNSLLQAMALTESLASDLFSLFPPQILANRDIDNGSSDQAASITVSTAPSLPTAQGSRVRRTLAKLLTRLAVARRPFGPKDFAAMTPFGLRGQQQDVTELARWVLEQLGEVEQESSLTCRCFGGRARTVVWCTSCGHTQAKEEAFSDLCLPITHVSSDNADPAVADQQPVLPSEHYTVAELLRAYLQHEVLPGYRCDSCGSVDSSNRRCDITHAPQNLIVILNRFCFSMDGGQQKVDAHVAADGVLSVPLCGTLSQEDAQHPDSGSTAEYSLYAFVTHVGSTPHSGHYMCYGRCSERADDPWRCYDDSAVRSLPGAVTQEALDGKANGSATAYMLFYRYHGDGSTRRVSTRFPSLFYVEAVLEQLFESSSSNSHVGASTNGHGSGARPNPKSFPDTQGGPDAGSNLGGGGGASWIC